MEPPQPTVLEEEVPDELPQVKGSQWVLEKPVPFLLQVRHLEQGTVVPVQVTLLELEQPEPLGVAKDVPQVLQTLRRHPLLDPPQPQLEEGTEHLVEFQ